MTCAIKHDAHGKVGVEGTFETTYTVIITRTATTVKHIPDGRANEPTQIVFEAYRRQSGYVEPHLIGLLSMAAPGAGALMALVMGWLL